MKKRRSIKKLVIAAIACLIIGSMMIGAGLIQGGDISYLHIGKDNTKWWPWDMSIGVLNTDIGDIDIGDIDVGDNDLFHKKDTKTWNVALHDTKDLEIVMDIGDVMIKKGSVSQVRFVDMRSEDVTVKEEKGKQKIIVKHPKNWNSKIDGHIEVSLSEDDLTLDVDMDLGDIEIEDLHFAKLSVDCALGDINLNHVTTANCEIDQNAGDILMNGTFLNQTEVENDLGDIDITIIGKEDEYNLKIDNDLGTTSIGDEQHSGSSEIKQNKKAKHTLSVSNHMGDIDIQFR